MAPKPLRQNLLNIDSLARGDRHMIARFNEAWSAAVAERATWPPLPANFDDIEPYSTEAVDRVAAMFGIITDAWARHLLARAGVGPNDRPPPTSSQQRKLVRLINEDGNSEDRGITLLAYWGSLLLRGDLDQLSFDARRLAGTMSDDILLSVLNHVRETSPAYNGKPLVEIEGGADA
jgi:hypothetical protein